MTIGLFKVKASGNNLDLEFYLKPFLGFFYPCTNLKLYSTTYYEIDLKSE